MLLFIIMQKFNLEQLLLPSLSLLRKLVSRGMDSLKAMKVLSENGSLLGDSALLIPEIYLLKSVQYHSGDFVGVDKDETSSKNAVLTVMKFLREISII